MYYSCVVRRETLTKRQRDLFNYRPEHWIHDISRQAPDRTRGIGVFFSIDIIRYYRVINFGHNFGFLGFLSHLNFDNAYLHTR